MADRVPELIAARFSASAGLRAALPGGLFHGRARDDVAGVFGTFQVVSAVPGWTTEDALYTEPTRVQFSVFGPTAAAVGAAIRTLCAHDPDGFDRLRDAPLDAGFALMAMRVSGPAGPFLDDAEGAAGARVWQSTADYVFHLSRSL